MPRIIKFAGVILAMLALIPILELAKQQVDDSAEPRVSLIPDMDNQSKVKTQRASPLFADGRGMRKAPEGTVAREDLVGDPHLRDGRVGGDWATTFPFAVTDSVVARGRGRFGIFCAPCHGLAGDGDGIVARRASALMEGTWVPPANLTDQTVRSRPVGHIYNTIRHGIRKMPPYGPQIPVRDRWAIVAYVRALQIAQAGSPDELTAQEREALGPPPPPPAAADTTAQATTPAPAPDGK